MSIYKNGERYDVEITPSGMSIDPSWDDIKDKPEFKPVATSGDYNDLENKPAIPSVGNGTVTINQGGAQKGQFTLNQSGNITIELDEGGVTEWDDIENKPDFKSVATSGDYNDLENKPDLSDVVRLSTTGGQMGIRASTGGFTIDSTNKNIDFTYASLKLDTPLWIRLSQSINLADGWTATLRGDETTKKRLVYNYRNDTVNNVQIPQYRTIGLILTASGSFHYIFSIGWTPTDINTAPSAIEWDNIQGKPDFKPVAISGDYNDLDNKPTIAEPKYVDFVWPTDTESEEIDQEFAQELWDNRDKYSSGIYRIRIINDPDMPVTADFFVTEEDPFQEICITAMVDNFIMSMFLTKVSGNWVIFTNDIRDFVTPRIIHYNLPGFTSGTVPASLYIADFWRQKTQIENGRVIIRGGERAFSGWPATFSKIAWIEDEEERQLIIAGSGIYTSDTVSVLYSQAASDDPSEDDWDVQISRHSVTHSSENWTFELEDGSTVTKKIWLD